MILLLFLPRFTGAVIGLIRVYGSVGGLADGIGVAYLSSGRIPPLPLSRRQRLLSY